MPELTAEHLQLIAQHGWMITFRELGERSAYRTGYTVGLSAKGLPELVVVVPVSVDPKAIPTVLNEAGRMATTWNRPLPPIFDAGHDLFLRTRWVTERNRKVWLPLVKEFAKGADFIAQQVFIPDAKGRYPWQPTCDIPFKVPLL